MKNPIIKINVKNLGSMTAELYPDKAPLTVANFVKLAETDFYNGLTFHRVIKDFMVQAGGFDKDGKEKAADAIAGEFLVNGFINFLPHNRGTLSMARTMDNYNSASSQFFIMHQNAAYLDGQYASFGAVTDGMDVVDEIANSETDENDKPKKDVVIKEINIIKEV